MALSDQHVTVTEADTYYAESSSPPIGWAGKTEDQKQGYIRMCTNRFGALPWPDEYMTLAQRAASDTVTLAFYELLRVVVEEGRFTPPGIFEAEKNNPLFGYPPVVRNILQNIFPGQSSLVTHAAVIQDLRP